MHPEPIVSLSSSTRRAQSSPNADAMTSAVWAQAWGVVASWSTGVDKMEGQSLGMVGTPAGDTGAPVSWQQATGKGGSPKL